ncbi:sensor histidine kinase [Phaeocystidibacter marisrubri]|uniref:HAMP domain-containing histidine kinase n=1 Tax=Phaeocystidibacter marisrubri TaxID=1577780 RepID=A0A6L3ZIG0_9FLAO|nr:HAMP domain-containing sensor histidine kinase [Phaeocystidibacter marisrubri]KAB2817796.1 HAMP domain-containing histidine kinase [Phaeocystidibacter marisrubri]GGH73494.1 hypothetical protein GCM10011318_18570 [Phaeocystidibacter marisrubri]
MKLYNRLGKYRLTSTSYSRKFLLVAFIGIHLPIIALVAALLFFDLTQSKWFVVLVVLIMTLLSSILTLSILNQLTSPIKHAAKGVIDYRDSRVMPSWPRQGNDELSHLLNNLESMLHELEVHRIHQEDMSMLLAHDLRSPISAAIQTIELCKVSKDINEVNESLDSLKLYLQDQLSFIDLMLQIQKHQSGIENFELEPVNLRPLVESCVSSLRRTLEEKNLKLEFKSSDDQVILAHPRMAAQCINNLLNNAIKFSYPNGVIEIAWECSGTTTVLSIRDYGTGFTEDVKQKLFDKILFGGASGTNGEKSNGLGLYLTKTLMRNQKGSVGAHSDGADKGATFSLTFNAL